MTAAEVQGWMTAIGVLLTAGVGLMGFIQSLRNGRALARATVASEIRADELSGHVGRVEAATNGMKKELEEKAFIAGARSVEDASTTDLVTRATETAAIAAKVVADAAKTAADLVAATAQARRKP